MPLRIFWTSSCWLADFEDTDLAQEWRNVFTSTLVPMPLTPDASFRDVLDHISDADVLPEFEIDVEVREFGL